MIEKIEKKHYIRMSNNNGVLNNHINDVESQQHDNHNIGEDGLPKMKEDSSFSKLSVEEETHVKTVGFLPTTMNLLNSLLGAGILSVPSTLASTGIIFSVILIFIMAALGWIATMIVIKLQDDLHVDGFGDLAQVVLGKWGSVSLGILSLLFLITAQLAYIIIAGEIITSWLDLGGIVVKGIWWRALIIFIYSVCLPMALTIPRNIHFLSYFSTATVIFTVFYLISMLIKGLIYIHKNHRINSSCIMFRCDLSMFSSLSIYALTFALPCVCMPVLAIFDKKKSRRDLVTLFAMTICFILVTIPALFGYFIFGSDTNGNILDSFSDSDVLIICVRSGFFFIVSFAYPIITQSTMVSWSHFIFNDSVPNKLPGIKRAVILGISNIIPLLIAMFLSKAKPVLSVGGALGGCLANFMFPAIMYVVNSKEKWSSWRNILSIIFAVFGLVAGVICTYEAVLSVIKAFS